MKKLITTRLIPILLTALIIGFIDAPYSLQSKVFEPFAMEGQKINLGLDLQGGTQLDYKIDLRKVEEADRGQIINGITEVINRRVNGLGVSEPNIYTSQVADEYHIIVELAGIKDIEEAKRTVGKTIQLEFKEPKEEITDEDKEEIRVSAEDALSRIQETDNFLLIGSEEEQAYPGKAFFTDASESFVSEDTIPSDAEREILSNLDDGEVYGSLLDVNRGQIFDYQGVQENTGYVLMKRLGADERGVEKTYEKEVEARRIVVTYTDTPMEGATHQRSKADAQAIIDEVKEKLETGESFAALAKQYSDEPAAAENGGLLVEPIKESSVQYYESTIINTALGMATGEVSDVVDTAFSLQLLKAENVTEARTENVTEKLYKYQSIFYSTVPDGWKDTELTGEHFQRADVVFNQFNQPIVNIKFRGEGGQLFADLTERNIGRPIAIFVGGELISAPNVNEKISAGEAQITGQFTPEEAQELARDLNTGAIPAPIVLSGQYSIGATLGQSALDQSIDAGMIGLVLLAVYMIAYYRKSGLLAVIALLIYAILLMFLIKISIPMLWAFGVALVVYSILISMILKNDDSGGEKLISFLVASFVFFFLMFLLASPVVLTLAGVAGVILSIGMAVDANVLIFERIKEEVSAGRPVKHAIEVGFDRAWSSIRDSNYSSLITCAILVYFGTSIIKGFAINLAAGILVSMFTAITITRAFLDIAAETERGRKFLKYGLARRKEPTFKIIQRSKLWLSFSSVLVLISLVATFTFGLNLGIDFTGGTMMEIKSVEQTEDFEPISSEGILNVFEEVETGNEEVELGGTLVLPSGEDSYIIRTRDISNELHDEILTQLSERFGAIEEPRFTVIGPTIGAVLKQKAGIALLVTALMIVVYIAFAFRKVPKEISPWRFGLCAIVALLHDITITVGIFAILGRYLNVELDALFVTALLTIMGFSVHDTIVVFDRVRENIFSSKKNVSFDDVANRALNQTMARSLNTSISTLFTVAALFIYGAESVKYFVLALLLGIIIGTYSSIFVASPVLCMWKKHAEK